MREARLRSAAFWSLVVITLFNALSAIGGGIGILVTDGLGMPDSFLEGGPFSTFVWPGVILLVVIGGSQALAGGLLLARRDSALLWSAVAGFGMVIWIFVETGMIRGISVLQILYFVTGALQLALVFALLGIVGWLPRDVLPGVRGGHELRRR
ncbi:hypothetical protein [Compostimonas suwonensis]|uniref:Uncharacterized protein n=1 Tax=Compostimonas suwonensis TaxID=1048394 RepID=A0A2M9BZ17_9MICO|nr:hypothetical protein [Compostimonas suwonensis]PJJ63322.1 hypothetical protein CLV54_0986 [Compostimonas suwonensis]